MGPRATIAALALLATQPLAAEATGPGLPPLLPREREVALALSAAPPHLRDAATIYVLEAQGYVKAREGSNGITCLVARERPESQEPICWDAEGALAIMPVAIEQARLRAEGKLPAEVDAEIARGFAAGRFRAPRRAGIAYMLSGENHVWNGQRVIHYHPHVMIYAPYVTNADIGAGGRSPWMPWVLGEGTPHAYIIVVTRPEGEETTKLK